MMKEEIKTSDIRQLNRWSAVYTVLLLLSALLPVPLMKWLGLWGLLPLGTVFTVTMVVAFKLEKFKKEHDIHTYREIVAFTEGKRLDELEKARESGKRPYQAILLAVASGVIAALLIIFLEWLL